MADEAIPAATLIVVRERSGSAPELLMVERAEGMAFAAGALVFPGGRIDQADLEAAALGTAQTVTENAAVQDNVTNPSDADEQNVSGM
jgi:hypothetical protein